MSPISRRRLADPELTLLPFMNLMTLLIPFLLLSAQFVSLAVIDSSLPGIIVNDGGPDVDPLHLTVGIGDEGFVLRGNAEGLDEDPIAKVGDAWDFAALTEALSAVKDAHPADETVMLAPEDHIDYETVIRTMDAARGTTRVLFPSVTFVGGVAQP